MRSTEDHAECRTDESLTRVLADIPDPRRAQERRHPLPVVLAIAAGAILCGMRGYKAIADWAQSLSPKARERFRCRRRQGAYRFPSESLFRDVSVRVDPVHLNGALQCGLW
jgi:DDE family transposase